MRYNLKSLEWLNGVDELVLDRKTEDVEENETPISEENDSVSLMLEWKMRISYDSDKCTTCNCNIDFSDRSSLLEHYQSEWHKENVRRKTKRMDILTEEEFEGSDRTEIESALQHQSTSGGSDDEDVDLCLLPAKRLFFVQNNQVYSISRNILWNEEEKISNAIFSRPFDCAIILLNGGHFAAGIFENDRLVQKHTFHRYVARAKQGGVQSQFDSGHGNAKSAGANLRRYNEAKLKESILKVILSWKSQLEKCPLIFLRCASYHKSLFLDADAGFSRGCPRVRTIPFETNRPTLDEILNVWNRLQVVEEHGDIELFRKTMIELRSRRKNIALKVQKSKQNISEQKKEKDRSKNENRDDRKKDHIKVRPVEPKMEDKWPELNDDLRKEIYTLIRTNNPEGIKSILENNPCKIQLIDYIRNVRFMPKNWSFLHLCAAKQLNDVLKFLLENVACDPSMKDSDGLPPYSLSPDKKTKAVFTKFREEFPENHVWSKTHIPEPAKEQILTPEEILNQQEKKREKKLRQKEKLKAKKEIELQLEEENKEKQRWLNLSERERRAEIVERRLAGLPPISRCEQCGKIVDSKNSLQYSHYNFCTSSCVAAHRAANP